MKAVTAMSTVNGSFYKGHTKQECSSKINPINKTFKRSLHLISYTEPTNER